MRSDSHRERARLYLLLGLLSLATIQCRESDNDVLVEPDYPEESTLQWEKRGPEIEEIAHEPMNYSLCPRLYGYETFTNVETWGWGRAEIDGDTIYGIASLSKSAATPDVDDDYFLSIYFTNFDRCIGLWHLAFHDLQWPLPQREKSAYKAWHHSCDLNENRMRMVWSETPERRASFVLLDYDEVIQGYHPDTTEGPRLRFVLDQLDTVRMIAVGRFVGRFYADPSCPVDVPQREVVTLERGYFQANIIPD